MKTPGRILTILTAFVLIMGITYVAVNTTGSSTTAPASERGAESLPHFANGERPDFACAGPGGGGWTVGLVRNIGIIAILVALIVGPKSFMRSMRRKVVPIPVE